MCVPFHVTEHFNLGDRELMQQLVFDAKATQWFSNDKNGKDDKSAEKTSEKG